jgi:hypothetical protein
MPWQMTAGSLAASCDVVYTWKSLMKKMFKYLLFVGFAISTGVAQAQMEDMKPLPGEGPDEGSEEWHRCLKRGGCK